MSVARRLGRYRIGERIGTGGVADVYRAQVEGAAGFAKTLVVKCLRPHMADEAELVEGLAREAKLAQRLHHGNIVQVFDFGVDEGQPYVVMEHVDGCSLYELLRDRVARGEPLGLEEALFVVEEVAAALRYVHGLTDDDGTPLHLVHRDVKPRNVLVSREGVVKLTDFGIAKVGGDRTDTLPGVVKGTPAYLAPEQATSRGVDARTDVFALGLVLRDVLGDGLQHHRLPTDPRVDDALWAICERATASDPAERYPNVSAMLRALQRWRAEHELEAHPGQLAAWVRRARQQAPLVAARALDAALLGDAPSLDSTHPDGSAPHTTRASAPPPVPDRRRPLLGLGLAGMLALGGVLWIALADPPSPSPSTSAAIETSTPDPEPPSPEPSPEPPSPEPPSPEPSPETPSPEPPSTEPATSSGPADPDAEPNPGSRPHTEPSTIGGDAPPPPPPPPRREAETGRLVVSLLPWAEVTIDGHPHGRVPIDVELAAGRHRVRLHNPQLGEVTRVIEVRAGQTYTLNKW